MFEFRYVGVDLIYQCSYTLLMLHVLCVHNSIAAEEFVPFAPSFQVSQQLLFAAFPLKPNSCHHLQHCMLL